MTLRKVEGILLIIICLISINAIWGLSTPTFISKWLIGFIPLNRVVAIGLILLIVKILMEIYRRNKPYVILLLLLISFISGVYATFFIEDSFKPSNTFLDRALFFFPIIFMMIVAIFSGLRNFPLKIGNWRRLSSLTNRSWYFNFVVPALIIIIFMLFIFFQSEGSAKSSLNQILIILALALLNGFGEEIIFRGFLMVPMMNVFGKKEGIWMQAIFFGLLHLGASPGLIAGLPSAIILIFLGFIFGKSVVETNGLSWAIAFHFVLDIVALSVMMI